MWRSNFTIPHSFAAYICRLCLPPIFWKSAYILSKCQYFMHVRIFLGKCQYLDDFGNDFLLDFVAANICVCFQYLFMHFCMRQYFWRNCFEA
jgi:hypothetical protein